MWSRYALCALGIIALTACNASGHSAAPAVTATQTRESTDALPIDEPTAKDIQQARLDWLGASPLADTHANAPSDHADTTGGE